MGSGDHRLHAHIKDRSCVDVLIFHPFIANLMNIKARGVNGCGLRCYAEVDLFSFCLMKAAFGHVQIQQGQGRVGSPDGSSNDYLTNRATDRWTDRWTDGQSPINRFFNPLSLMDFLTIWAS